MKIAAWMVCVVGVALLAACAPQRQVSWYPAGSKEPAKDQFECERDATMMYPVGRGDTVSQAVANVNRQNAYGQCLSARGWVAR